ncbi:MAG: helix-turn-helix domain-containing protein [Chitinivibrionales bacterium]|nr:helix-turn-helix domain-containing protein [Chitinivibrionales bacterium]
MHTIAIAQRIEFTGRDIGMPLIERSGFDSFSEPLGLGKHIHRGFELTYVFEGRVSWEIAGGELLTLSGWDMAITQPGVPHRGYRNIIEPASIFWLGVAPDPRRAGRGSGLDREELSSIGDAFRGAGHAVRFTAGALHDTLARLHTALAVLRNHRHPPLAKAQCRVLITDVLIRAAEILRGHPHRRTPDAYASAAVDFMKRSLREPIAIDEVARQVGISPSRLHAVFKQCLGMTPNDYLQRLRIDTACALLSSTPTPITRIALDLGFTSSQYFATCFRKYVGISPGAYRRDCRLRIDD